MTVLVRNVAIVHFYNCINKPTGLSALKRPKITKFGYLYAGSIKSVIALNGVHGK